MNKVLDCCCGSRMFWFDKNDERCTFMDKRQVEMVLGDGRKLSVKPDVVGDFREMPFDSESFNLVIFDPPHLKSAGPKSWLRAKYGMLDPNTWKDDIRRGFSECFRVLKHGGTLVFKWNDEQIHISEILNLTNEKPLIMHKRQKTKFVIFYKG